LYTLKTPSETFNKIKAIPLLLVILQVALGILSVLTSPGIIPNHWGAFDWFAQLHQVAGMLFALALVGLFYTVRRR
jgi:cytochrome c oxidase assembly protein subunit 15